jgi:hypothetical protein
MVLENWLTSILSNLTKTNREAYLIRDSYGEGIAMMRYLGQLRCMASKLVSVDPTASALYTDCVQRLARGLINILVGNFRLLLCE